MTRADQITQLQHSDGTLSLPTGDVSLVVGAGTGLGVGFVIHHGGTICAYLVTPGTRVDAVLEQMVRGGTTRSLVVDGERRLLGVVTLSDILLSRGQQR